MALVTASTKISKQLSCSEKALEEEVEDACRTVVTARQQERMSGRVRMIQKLCGLVMLGELFPNGHNLRTVSMRWTMSTSVLSGHASQCILAHLLDPDFGS